MKTASNEPNKAKCSGPSVYEIQLQGSLVSAFNRLPEYRAQLEAERGMLQTLLGDELLAKVADFDARIERLENAAAYASEGLELTPGSDTASGDTESETETAANKTAAEEFRNQIEELKKEKAAYLSEKAEYGMKLAQLQSLLRLVDAIESRTAPVPAGQSAGPCTDLSDFYEKTDRIQHRGPVYLYDEWMVVRFIEKVIVHPDRLEIVFKAGLRINLFFGK